MRATRRAIRAALHRHVPHGAEVDLLDLYGIIELAISLDSEDWTSDGYGQSRWKRNVRNVLQELRATGGVIRIDRGRYLIP